MSALESLTANYTDSEEENTRSDDERSGSPVSDGRKSAESPGSCPQPPGGSGRSTPSKLTRLVSYGGEDKDEEAAADKSPPEEAEDGRDNNKGGGDDDGDGENNEPVDMEIDTEDDDQKDYGGQSDHPEASKKPPAAEDESLVDDSRNAPPLVDAWTEGAQLPPDPAGSCSPTLQENIAKLHNRKGETGYDMNSVIQSKKAFRNPSIYKKLIQFCNIDEHGTNFPKDLYDGHLFGPESYYDELAKAQKVDMEKREKAAKERQSKEAATSKKPAVAAAATDDASAPTKRRSKWDQGPSSNAAAAQAQAASVAANLPVLRTTNLSSASGGSAAKSIPAFGMLKRHH